MPNGKQYLYLAYKWYPFSSPFSTFSSARRMALLFMKGFPLYGILLFSLGVQGQHHILLKYKKAMQNYLMTGHEMTWHDCDILSANGYSNNDGPQITMSLEKIETLNVKYVFSLDSQRK